MQNDIKDINIFIPCCIDRFKPDTAKNLFNLFEMLKIRVNYNPDLICCGRTTFRQGLFDDAKKVGGKLLDAFNNKNYIVCPSSACVAFVRNYYEQLFHNTSYHLANKSVGERIFELSDFLVNVLRITDFGAEFPHKVTFHDTCSALREYKLTEEPRILLQNVRGLELIEMDNRDLCCGSSALFPLQFEAVSAAMAAEKLSYALETKAEYIVSTDYSCLLNLEAYINKHKIPLKCIHIVDILANSAEE